jgi:hypothetical protein
MPPGFPGTFLLADGYAYATIGSRGTGEVKTGKDAFAEIETVADSPGVFKPGARG